MDRDYTRRISNKWLFAAVYKNLINFILHVSSFNCNGIEKVVDLVDRLIRLDICNLALNLGT